MKNIETTLLILKRGERICLAMKKRGFGAGRFNGVGGKVKAGETIERAMVRETTEEIGVEPTEFERVGEIELDEIFGGGRARVRMHVYIATDFSGEPTESDEMRPEWFAIGAIPYEKMFPDDRFWLARVLSGEKIKARFKLDKNLKITAHAIAKVENMDEEILDVYDEHKKPTGEIVGRNEAHRNGVCHIAVGVYIVNKNKQILLQKRAATTRTNAGCWDMSAAGHVNAGETSADAVVRETREELGLGIKKGDMFLFSSEPSEKKTDKIWDKQHNERYIAWANPDVAKIKVDKSEVDCVRWFDFAEFKDMVQNQSPQLSAKWGAHEALIKYLESR